jgi:hypothetical protein
MKEQPAGSMSKAERKANHRWTESGQALGGAKGEKQQIMVEDH